MKESQKKKSIIGSHPEGSCDEFTHCPKDPDGETFKPYKRMSDTARSTNFGDLIPAGHTLLNVRNESKWRQKRSHRVR